MEKKPNPKAIEALCEYFPLRQRLNNYFFKKEPLKITNIESANAYSRVYNLLNDSSAKIENDKKFETLEVTFLEQYKSDLTDFARRACEIMKNVKDMHCQDQIQFFYTWIINYTRFTHSIYRTFMTLERIALHVQGTSVYNEGLKILRAEIMEKLQDEIYNGIYQCLQVYKTTGLKWNEPLQEMIKIIGTIGFTKYRHVTLQKLKQRFQFTSYDRQKHQQIQNSYTTDYFKKHFENKLIKDLKIKYSNLAQSLSQLSTQQYVDKATSFIQSQMNAADMFYPNKVVKDRLIKAAVFEVLVVERAEALLKNQKTGLSMMMRARDIDNIKKIFVLLDRAGMLKIFFKEFQIYIQKEGESILNKISPEDEKAMKKETVLGVCGEILEFSDAIDTLRLQIDQEDAELQAAQNVGFQAFCNFGSKVCNFLAYYVDIVLKKEESSIGFTAELVTQVGKITRYLYSYDAFLKLHQKLLGIRILYDNFKNIETEYSLINLFKSEAGVSATTKISNMISDYKLSQKWNQEIKSRCKFEINMQVMMLTSGVWEVPDPKNGRQCVPIELMSSVLMYEQVFFKLMPNRSVTWIFNHGRAIAKVRFNTIDHMLILNNYQLVTLLYIQRKGFKPVKYGQLIAQLQVSEEQYFAGSLGMLIKLGILTKLSQGIKIQSKSEELTFNLNFKYKTAKVMCLTLPKLSEKSAINNQLSADRSYLIDAAIIKLLKQRRKMVFSELIVQTQKMCKTFKAETGMIKLRIENCQQRQFLERDPNDMNMLIYKP